MTEYTIEVILFCVAIGIVLWFVHLILWPFRHKVMKFINDSFKAILGGSRKVQHENAEAVPIKINEVGMEDGSLVDSDDEEKSKIKKDNNSEGIDDRDSQANRHGSRIIVETDANHAKRPPAVITISVIKVASKK